MAEQSGEKSVILCFDDVSFSYDTTPVLEHVNLHIHEGDFATLVGKNGAGKTTILKLILGIEKASAGTIELFGRSPSEGCRKIGYIPQQTIYDPAFPVSVKEVVKMGRLHPLSRKFSAEDNEAVERALSQADISELGNRPYAALSGGQRRRVLLARALSIEPDLLILDEPTANMDVESENRLYRTLGDLKGKTTILIVTHDTDFVSSLTDSVFCVGEYNPETGKSNRSVVRHNISKVEEEKGQTAGGNEYRILHNSDISDHCIHCQHKNRDMAGKDKIT
ncbi:metal ABC transporter ATP-binding protein [Brucepastera parasyntrophica]|uniref:metal ABC transporter ATP-binding protein n=1 Tax=Brucepastera parasyntrophica TaxID=2880008 RepID=UPI002109D391|nr:metal ABC transporter ATP-binding protein [Brucepastera parasyntrophica]ULQ60847.1 metal ABC transporter ATP-binding protein [Brucepastera parasyntrophica]